jgi:hypothetical protein
MTVIRGFTWDLPVIIVDMQSTVPRAASAKYLLRLPHGLHAALKQQAAQEGVSLNTLMATLLAGTVGWQGPRRAPAPRQRPGA